MEYFLGKEGKEFCLSASEKHQSFALKPLKEIEEAMKRMDLDEAFIRTRINELKRMEDYDAEQGNNRT